MNTKITCVSALFLLSLVAPLHAAMPDPKAKPDQVQVKKALDKIAAEVNNVILAREKIHNRFDLLRRLKEQGLTWQPSLIAPNNLINTLEPEKLRFFAGAKFLDALYAATFSQGKAVTDQLQTLQAINEKLDVRAYADLKGTVIDSLNKAAANPDAMDLQKMIDDLATHYTGDISALTASEQGVRYLLDSLYGFTVETGYMLGNFHRLDPKGEGTLMKALRQPENSIVEWMEAIVALYDAYGLSNDTIIVNGQKTQKLGFIKQIIEAHHRMLKQPGYKPENRDQVYAQADAIRTAMLTPSTP